MSHQHLDRLRDWFLSAKRCLIAYSGGVDSVLLAVVGHQVLGLDSVAVIADSPSLARQELLEAQELAEQYQFQLRIIRTREFENPNYLANPSNRCYFCKSELFSELTPIAAELGIGTVVYGENASDQWDDRPGAKAALEFAVRAPLRELGLTKADVRSISAVLGLPTAEKPQMACLSSRVPQGEPVTEPKLRMIEAAEGVLRSLGFYDVRVRHHEITNGALARIELGVNEIQRALDPTLRTSITHSLAAAGYQFVTLDLVGYQRRAGPGSLAASEGASGAPNTGRQVPGKLPPV